MNWSALATTDWVSMLIAINIFFWGMVVPASLVSGLVDRKLGASLQARVGPNQAGPFAGFQLLADALKLLQKSAREQATVLEKAWLLVAVMALFSTLAILPVGSLMVLVDVEMTAFLPMVALVVVAIALLNVGISQRSVAGTLGGFRRTSQTINGLLPAILAVLCASLAAGGFRWQDFAHAQGFFPTQMILFSSPFQPVAFFVFFVSGLIITGSAPFDTSAGSSDIKGGVFRSLSGMGFAFMRLARFYALLFWAAMTAVLFLGAWRLPESWESLLSGAQGWFQFLEAVVLLAKTVFLILLVSLVSKVVPRIRSDQVSDFSWRVLSPLSLMALVGSVIWIWLAQ